MFEYFTLDDFQFNGKIVGVRVDINSPIKNGSIMMNQRIKDCAITLNELSKKGTRIVVLAHQGRQGSEDCISLENHLRELKKLLIGKITFSKEIYSKDVEEKIANLEEGDVLLLENLRFYDDELNPSLKNNNIIKLQNFFDYYVFDAFSLAHRKHTSVLGFTKIPNIAGRLMEKELKGLHIIENTSAPHIFCLGGAKPDDLVPLIKDSLDSGHVETVLLSGVIGEVGLIAQGYHLGKKQQFLESHNWLEIKEDLKNLLDTYPHEIVLPKDVVVVDSKGKRTEIPLSKIGDQKEVLETQMVQDIGSLTSTYYHSLLQQANSIYFKGPPGNFEVKGGDTGTKKLLSSITSSSAFTFMGGGHSVTAASDYGFFDKFSYVSLAGGALVKFLEGKTLPGVKRLEESHKAYEKHFEDFIVVGSNTIDYGVKIPQKLAELTLGDKVKIQEDFKQTVGGGGINVSIAISRLGGKVGYLGKFSHETFTNVNQELEKNGITTIKTVKSRKPGAKSIVLNTSDNDRVIFTYRGQNGALEFKDIDTSEITSANYYFTSLTGSGFQTLLELAKYLSKNIENYTICYNPSSYIIGNEPKLSQLIKLVDIIVVNVEEGQHLSGKKKVSDILASLVSMGPKVAVVTAGSRGAYAFDGIREYRTPALSTRVIDTTGAGDSFAATFYYFYSKGYGIKRSMEYAANNSASVITQKGASNGLLYKEDLIK